MTGHGGDEFLKFQDNEEVSAFDIADAIEQMHEKRRYVDALVWTARSLRGLGRDRVPALTPREIGHMGSDTERLTR